MKKKIIILMGTRPEAIKLCPLYLALKKERKHFSTLAVSTGQHREMLAQVAAAFKVPFRHDLKLMRRKQTPCDIAARAIKRFDAIVRAEKPDMIIVQGDTTTAFSGAVVGFYNRVAVAHVEAGLRTFDRDHPFPEEFNRKAASVAARLNLAPTPSARRNLIAEGYEKDTIFVTGNTVIDALKTITARGTGRSPLLANRKHNILVTIHRRESWGEGLKNIFTAIRTIADRHDDAHVLFPVHPNPVVSKAAHEILGRTANVTLTKPLGYLDFVDVMRGAYLILTDSGGVQEEAPSLGIPVLVARKVTERPEAVRAGCVKLVGSDRRAIVRNMQRLLTDKRAYATMQRAVNPYGDGRASARIVRAMKYFFGIRRKRPQDFKP